MDVFRVKFNEKIIVHQRYMLFSFEFEEAAPGKVHADCFFPPYFEKDGRPAPFDTLERDTLDIGETLSLEHDGSETGIQSGTVDITVAAVEGGEVTVYVTVPDGWGAVKEADITGPDGSAS